MVAKDAAIFNGDCLVAGWIGGLMMTLLLLPLLLGVLRVVLLFCGVWASRRCGGFPAKGIGAWLIIGAV